MISALISNASPEKVSVYRFEEVVTDRGGTKKTPVLLKKNLIVSVQTSGSTHSVGGMAIINNIAGKTNKSVFVVYSPRFKMLVKDLLVRADGLIYEVHQVEHNGVGTLLEHDKYYIVECDNQKALKNE